MPADTALSRVTKSDFFAILGSGTYVVTSYALLAGALLNRAQPARTTIVEFSQAMEAHWPLTVGTLFFAFLVGNVLRALPVNLPDNLSKFAFGWIGKRKSEYHRALWESAFPYGDMLELELKALKANLSDLQFSIPRKGTRHSMFNYWKAEICRESTAAFEFTQELEGRVRLFATMFWAAALGFLAGIAGLLLSSREILSTSWFGVMICLSILSVVICFVFGTQLRRVRGQEVAGVFSAYISLLLKKTTQNAKD